MGEIAIRPVTSLDEMYQVEEVQRVLWAGDEAMIVHTHMLLTIARNGGLVLGAFDGDKVVGFLIGFLGADEGDERRPVMTRLKHVSKRMGVLPEYQDLGLGYRMKLAQRDFAIKQGVRLITWTFDPLRSRNAYFNTHKLGAVVERYLRDYYGRLEDAQNVGLPTDRLLAEWWITSRRVERRLAGKREPLSISHYTQAGAVILNPARSDGDGAVRPSDVIRSPEGRWLLIEIPTDFDAILASDMGLALAWRMHIRELFEDAFARGYMVTDFIRQVVEGRERGFYVLTAK